jgi:hypothetical protein
MMLPLEQCKIFDLQRNELGQKAIFSFTVRRTHEANSIISIEKLTSRSRSSGGE